MGNAHPIQKMQADLAKTGYIAERDLASTLVLFESLQRPVLLEGMPGVGKTEIAKSLSQIHNCDLIRLQCYEGLDVYSSLYEWNYQHQLLSLKLVEKGDLSKKEAEKQIFSRDYLLERPLLKAITQPVRPVLLIDEVDRADEEFEAFLLELLSDFQVTVPELGIIEAVTKPRVILTSNGTRELSDALRRRCLYHYLEFPEFDKELNIVLQRVPEVGPQLARQIVGFVHELRKIDLSRRPGVAETLDWAAALLRLNVSTLDEDEQSVIDSMTCLLKTREDNLNVTDADIHHLIVKAA